MSRVINITDTVIVGPADPPMTVEYARRHIKALTGSDDVMIANWIQAAAQFFERKTGRPIVNRTYEAWTDAFPACRGKIELPHPPLQSVVSVSYVNDAGEVVTFDDGGSPQTVLYQTKAPAGTYAERGYIEPLYGVEWPTARCESGAVRIRYTAGYGTTQSEVPELITGILCYLVGHFDQYRSAAVDQQRGNVITLPFGVEQMMASFTYSALPSIQMRSAW